MIKPRKVLNFIFSLALIGITFGNSWAQEYCIPSFSSSCSSGYSLTSFVLTGEDGTAILDDTIVCDNFGYEDFTHKDTLFLFTSQEYTVYFQAGNTGLWASVWIDYNDDFTFSYSESIIPNTEQVSTTNRTEYTFSIPEETPYGAHRMRVMIKSSAFMINNTCDPASDGAYWGTAYDYIVNIIPKPDCSRPDYLYSTNVYLDSSNPSKFTIDLNWDELNEASNWEVKYGDGNPIYPNTAGNGLEVTGTTGITINNLEPNTYYYFYVKSKCNPGQSESLWFGPLVEKVPCLPETVPFLEDFNDVTYPLLPECASMINQSNGSNWETALGGGQYDEGVLRYTSTGQVADVWYFTPGIQLEEGVNYALRYKYGSGSGNSEKMKVAIGNRPLVNHMGAVLEDYPLIQTFGAIETAENLFTAPTSGIYYFGFNCYSHANSQRLTVDDIMVDFGPTCLIPTDFYSLPYSDSIYLSWTDDNEATQWEIKYQENSNFDPETEGNSFLAEELPNAMIEGLTPSSSYYFYIRSLCDPENDFSEWVGPLITKTHCSYIDVPYAQDFEGPLPPGQAFPECGRTDTGEGTYDWHVEQVSRPTGYSTTTTTKAIVFNDYTPESVWYFVRGINMEVGKTYELKYTYGGNPSIGNNPFKVGIGSYPLGDSVSDILRDYPIVRITGLKPDRVYFTPPKEGVYFFGLLKPSSSTGPLLVDDIEIDTVQCPMPSEGEFTDFNTESGNITLNWIEKGFSSVWDLEVVPTGYQPEMGYGTLFEEITENPFSTTVDVSQTNEFYVRSRCGTTDTSDWSGPFEINEYCENEMFVLEDIRFFTQLESTGAMSNVSYSYSVPGYLLNFPLIPEQSSKQTQQHLVVYPGMDFQITARASSGNGFYVFSNFVDWNNNLEFEEDELVANHVYHDQEYDNQFLNNQFKNTYTITIPVDTPNGSYRMRVRMYPPGSHGHNVALTCNNQHGQTADFILIVEDPPSCKKPSELKATTLFIDKANIVWEEKGTATSWEIKYHEESNFNPDSLGISLLVSGTPETAIEGLSTDTDYFVYVRAICGAGDSSIWAGPLRIRTTCNSFQVPFSINLNQSPSSNILECLRYETHGVGHRWDYNGGFPLIPGMHFRSRGDFEEASDAWLFTPGIELQADTSYSFDFIYRNTELYNQKMNIFYGVSPTVDGMDYFLFNDSSIFYTDFKNEKTYFTVPEDGVYYFGFHAYSDVNHNDLYMNNIEIDYAPLCKDPTHFKTVGFTDETVHLVWDSNNSEEWEVKHQMETDFDPTSMNGAITSVSVFDSSEVTIEGLETSTVYYFYLKSACADENDPESWMGPLVVQTDCPYATIPFSQDFESVPQPNLPPCGRTRRYDYNIGNDWKTETFPSYENNNLAIELHSNVSTNSWYFTQGIFMEAGLEYEISYDYTTNYQMSTAYTFNLSTYIGNGSSKDSMSILIKHYTDLNTEQIEHEFQTFTVPESGVYFIGFHNYSNRGSNRLYIDNLYVDAFQTCAKPTDLTIVNTGVNSVEISWTENDDAEEWEIKYSDDPDFDPETEGESLLVQGNPEAIITELLDNTMYYFYVKSKCVPGEDESYWSDPLSVTTECTYTTVPFFQDFESETVPILPHCSNHELIPGYSYHEWRTDDFVPIGFGGEKLLSCVTNSAYVTNAWYYTQGILLQAGTEYQISYVLGNNPPQMVEEKMNVAFGTEPNAEAMIYEIADHNSIYWSTPQHLNYTFTVPEDDVYYFGFHVYSDANRHMIFLDNILIVDYSSCDDVSKEVCSNDEVLLTDLLEIGFNAQNWSFPLHPEALQGDYLNTSILTPGTYQLFYDDLGICAQEIMVNLTVVAFNSAGEGGEIEACINETVDLFDGLSGDYSETGTWHNALGDELSESIQIMPEEPGSYLYTYETPENGICSSDEATIIITVEDCDPSGISTNDLGGLFIHPNPTSHAIIINNPSVLQNLEMELLDINGRVVIKATLSSSVPTKVNVENIASGIYTLRIFNEQGHRIFKVVKN